MKTINHKPNPMMMRRQFSLTIVVLAMLAAAQTVSAQTKQTEAVADSSLQVFINVSGGEPMFRGGKAGLEEYLKKMVVYPWKCIEDRIEGRVIVSFWVEKDGNISEAKVVRSVDPRLDCEALRAVWHMPKWAPARQMGNVVRMRCAIPVDFWLSDLEMEQKAQPSNAQGVDAHKPAATSGNKLSDHRLPNR